MSGGGRGDNSEVLFEFVQLGNVMRVAAFDVATGTEVFVITPVSASQYHMQMLALGKLRRRLEQLRAGAAPPPGDPPRYA